MRLLIGIVSGLVFSLTCYGQVTEKDSLISTMYNDVLMTKCFEGLTRPAKLDSLEEKLGFHFCSIAACVNPFSVEYIKGQNRELVKLRLEELAERLVKEGTPVMLILGGLSGGDRANKLNSEKNEYNLKYLSTGNYCEVTETESYFEEVFNKRTNKLLGLKENKKIRRKATSRQQRL
jgi:hypothetical protein